MYCVALIPSYIPNRFSLTLFSSKPTIYTSNNHQPLSQIRFAYVDISIYLLLNHHRSQTTPTRNMFNFLNSTSSKKATPPSLINFDTTSRDEWMAKNSLKGNLTHDSLLRAIYQPEFDRLKQTTTEGDVKTPKSDLTRVLNFTYHGDTKKLGYADGIPSFTSCGELEWLTAHADMLRDGVHERDSRFSRMLVLGGKITMDAKGSDTNIIAFQADDGDSENSQTATIIHGFADEEYRDFWAGVGKHRKRNTITEPEGFPPLAQTKAKIVAAMLSSLGSRATDQISPSTDIDWENVLDAGPSSYESQKSLLDRRIAPPMRRIGTRRTWSDRWENCFL